MSETVTFEVSEELKNAIETLRKSGQPISLEIQGSVVGEDLVIEQVDSKAVKRGGISQHCWHALSRKLIDEKEMNKED